VNGQFAYLVEVQCFRSLFDVGTVRSRTSFLDKMRTNNISILQSGGKTVSSTAKPLLEAFP